jgi:hypothetical protein
MNATLSPDKIKAFHAILAKQGAMAEKENILSQYGATSTKQLNNHQLDEIINRLNGIGSRPGTMGVDWRKFDKNNTQHKYILSLCHQLGWVVWDNRNNRHIADMNALATWLQRKSIYKQPLCSLDRGQLQQTIYQLEQVLTTI